MTGLPELVPCLTAPLAEVKELLAACEEADIPARLAREACCDKGGGCAPKFDLLVAPADVPRVAALLARRWEGLLEREGVTTPSRAGAPASGATEEPPCPACGTAAPLVAGACSDCGLQLE